MNVHSLTFWSNQQRELIREESKRRGLRLFVFGVYKQETKKEGGSYIIIMSGEEGAGRRQRRRLEIATIVQGLINDYGHVNNKKVWDLDKLLFSLRETQKMNLLRGWRPEHVEESTFLTDAVASKKPEIVAILLFHGADPEQICPQRGSFCAFDEAFTFQSSEAIPSRRNNFFNIMCTLLNTFSGRRSRAERMYVDDYLHGFDVNAFSIVDFDGEKTVLMQCVCANMPFCVRWLIRNRNANVHVKKNRANNKNAIFFCMEAYSEKLRFLQNYQESEYEQRHFINWWLIARELIDHGADAMEWSQVFPEAWNFIAQYIQVTRSVPGHELNASPMSYLEWPLYMQLQPAVSSYPYIL